ncbi:MAG: hypothetical protein IKP88_18485 [Lachnospiraceae bacterium]|nr:hypothetical protein [Lachnospiraceae bacterium]
MGLFGRKKKKDKNTGYEWMTVDEALAVKEGRSRKTDKDPESFLDSIQEQLKNSERISNETGHEYEEVEKHISDIELYESLPKQLSAKINELAENLIAYEKMREDYQNGTRHISIEKYKVMDMYRDEIPDKLKTMEEQEAYLNLVKDDMRQLEGEKGVISYEKKEAVKKKKFLIKFTELTVVALVAVSILLLVLSNYTGKSMLLPFLIMAALASIYAAYFVVTMKECDSIVAMNDRLMNRAVELLNKVKIKYVNTVNALDYTYEKYMCNSHQELAYIWQGYLKEKEEENRYKKNTGLLSACQDSLSEVLDDAGFKLPQMWIHQAEFFTDRHSLHELKAVLLERHRKLKIQLDFNEKQKSGMVSDIKAFVKKHPEYSEILGST